MTIQTEIKKMVKEHLNTHSEIHTASVAENNQPEEPHKASLLTLNGTLLIIAVSFIIFTIIMQKIFYGPIFRIRQKRTQYIKGIKSDAMKAQQETEELKKDYTAKILAARKKVSEKTAKAIKEANEEKLQILEEKKQDAHRFLEEGRHRIHRERHKTFESLKENISGYAFDISKKILNEEIPIIGVSQEAIDKAINR